MVWIPIYLNHVRKREAVSSILYKSYPQQRGVNEWGEFQMRGGGFHFYLSKCSRTDSRGEGRDTHMKRKFKK